MKKYFVKILITMLCLLFISSCSSSDNVVVEENITDNNQIVVTGSDVSYLYSSLSEIYLSYNGNDNILILLPNEYLFDGNSFSNNLEENIKWTVSLNEESEIENFLDFLDDYIMSDDAINSGTVFLNNTYQKQIYYPNDNLIDFYMVMNYYGMNFYLTVSYQTTGLNTEEIALLHDLKDVYLLEIMDIPEVIIDEPEDLDTYTDSYEVSEDFSDLELPDAD